MNQRAVTWDLLEKKAQQMQSSRLCDLFEQDPKRVNNYSIAFDKIYLDYSKNFLDDKIMSLLKDLAESCELSCAIHNLFSGALINTNEAKPALHMALRKDLNSTLIVNNVNIMGQIKAQREKMYHLINQLHQGIYKGANGSKITDVVNIGIGGSDLGPVMAVEALKEYCQSNIKLHFVSNIDPEMIVGILKECSPCSTLFIISSKSFTTPETLYNATVAKKWLEENLQTSIQNHFIAITANPEKAKAYGILPENILQFWEWVGGRYSIWSSIGLPLAISIGQEHFEEFLLGARKMDEHFASAPFEKNMPVLLALIGIWYINFWHAKTLAVLPYSTRLRYFSDYLQQLDMESNGKTPAFSNEATSPIVWGQVGTNGQHAFFQLLHQGTHFIPVDFIIAKTSHTSYNQQHLHLLANCFAQASALMQGSVDKQFAHKHMPGNKPSNMLLLEKLTPRALGQLLALYEHKVFVQGIIWGINSFDQPGVELGKKLAHTVISGLEKGTIDEKMDLSTRSLIEKIRA